eukprot:TRINITY_DN6856_c0_g1_i1.p1 TRINITY_DN6856_c0_g1~~TRINITY_DN6856_c0_g1_i1.p1  ORF type:complete len:689 (+),score=108.82 TRINITY_DN6856_c0_g1_i1:157-2067(+)
MVTDNKKPSLTCPRDSTLKLDPTAASIAATYPDALAQDDSGVEGVRIEYNLTRGTLLSVGVTPVLVTASDEAGNTATCTFVLSVVDVTPPELQCEEIVQITTEPGLATGSLSASSIAAIPVFDSVDGPSSSASCSPSHQLAIGENTIECQATDSSGNRGTCQLTVRVVDDEAPNLTCGDQISTISSASTPGLLTYSLPSAADNVDGRITATCKPAILTGVGLGVIEIVCEASDASSNTEVCTFEVDVQVGPVNCLGDFADWLPCSSCPTFERDQFFVASVPASNGGQACPANRREKCGTCADYKFEATLTNVNLDVLDSAIIVEYETALKQRARTAVQMVHPASVATLVKIHIPEFEQQRRRENSEATIDIEVASPATEADIKAALAQLLPAMDQVLPGAVTSETTLSINSASGNGDNTRESTSSQGAKWNHGATAGLAALAVVIILMVLIVVWRRRAVGDDGDDKVSTVGHDFSRSASVIHNPLFNNGSEQLQSGIPDPLQEQTQELDGEGYLAPAAFMDGEYQEISYEAVGNAAAYQQPMYAQTGGSKVDINNLLPMSRRAVDLVSRQCMHKQLSTMTTTKNLSCIIQRKAMQRSQKASKDMQSPLSCWMDLTMLHMGSGTMMMVLTISRRPDT